MDVVQTADVEMGRLMALFQAWEGSMRAHLQAHGFWCNAVDPRTAHALHGSMGAKYSEAIGAQVLLLYPVSNNRLCSIVRHPRQGVHTYPVTFFTTAPLVLVHAALATACTIDAAALHVHAAAVDHTAPLLVVCSATVAHASLSGAYAHGDVHMQRCVAQDISFELLRGQRLLIRGPPGAGKTTFLHALRGMLPLARGWIGWGPHVRAAFVPQMPLLAPAASLRAQVMYPQAGLCNEAVAGEMLRAVGLGALWDRWTAAMVRAHGPHWALDGADEWNSPPLSLSGGELQCLAIARVLRVRPDVVLLDEAFSAVPPDVEASLLAALRSAGVSVVMVSHREASAAGASAALTFNAALPAGWVLDRPRVVLS